MRTFRYERKFLTSLLPGEAEPLIRNNPACFSSAFPARRIHNIYFDTPGLDFYNDNIEGLSERLKIRIRWYGGNPDFALNPVLELKRKTSFFGEKDSYTLPSFRVRDARSTDFEKALREALVPVNLKHYLSLVRPVVYNTYLRKYFLSSDGVFRLTLDDDMTYAPVPSGGMRFLSGRTDHGQRLFELKYSVSDDGLADRISGEFPFRLTRNSKYLRGVELVCL